MKTKAEARKRCAYCLKNVDQPERGRKRKYCSGACRNKAYRARQGKHDRAWHKRQREEARIAALPLTERVFDVEHDQPLYVMSDGKQMYRCMTCGEAYVEKRTKKPQSGRFCSHKCEQKASYHWRKAEDALIVLQQQNSRRSWAVSARMNEGKLPGLCPVCGLPFVPNTGKPGRPRKYCSATCKKVAYELKWRREHNGAARRHRFRHCAECGEKFDRTDKQGRRWMRFCSRICNNRAKDRTHHLREKGLKAPYRPKRRQEKTGRSPKIKYNQTRRDGFDPKTGWSVAIAERIRALGLDEKSGGATAKASRGE
jgi:endogenous inhibitor of DNA gyrase (YacG/DUF329 family)